MTDFTNDLDHSIVLKEEISIFSGGGGGGEGREQDFLWSQKICIPLLFFSLFHLVKYRTNWPKFWQLRKATFLLIGQLAENFHFILFFLSLPSLPLFFNLSRIFFKVFGNRVESRLRLWELDKWGHWMQRKI